MPNWGKILEEMTSQGSADIVRRKYLARLQRITGRNLIAYYSGWLQKAGSPGLSINDYDKNGFMSAIHGLDRSKGLDLILHTPGGEMAATESIVDYLRRMFGPDIRAIVPQLAMSGGTMIACSCKSIVMGKHSSLGPIDPQFGVLPAHGVLEEFKQATEEVRNNPATIPLWQAIISKYPPTLIGECQKSIDWANRMTKEWLISGMFEGEEDAEDKANVVLSELGDHSITLSHSRHLSFEKCREIGLKIELLEDDNAMQDAVLSVHHAFMHTLASTNAFKIIENHKGIALVQRKFVVTQPG